MDDRLGTSRGASSNILAWMIEFSSVLLNRNLVSKDGKTSYGRLKGKQSKVLGFAFAEAVLFRRVSTPGRLGKLDSLWENTFIGYRSASGEYMVTNANSVYKTRTIRSVPEEVRWKAENIEAIKFTPWRTKEATSRTPPGDPDNADKQPSIHIEVNTNVETEIPPPPRPTETVPRRVYITKALVERSGSTEECTGCTNAALGGTGMVHSEECRKRIDQELRKDPETAGKLRASFKRRKEFVKQHGLN